MDILVSALILAALFPVGLFVCLTIKLDSKGPCFYRQQRLGLFERHFWLLKFRTMTLSPHRDTSQTLPGDSDITTVGKFLRRSKIDETAQLINVLYGHMSLVGPRPCLPNLLEKMDDASRNRFHVRPGLSGLAQVNGNIYLDWTERWKYDCHYVKNLSFLMDLTILYRTLLVVLFGEKYLLSNDDKGNKRWKFC